MQETLKPKKTKTIIIALLLILVSATGLTVYILTRHIPPGPPLDYGGISTSGVLSVSRINETSSAGFSLWNSGESSLKIEKVQVCFNDNQTELVELVFVKILPNQGTGTLSGTPEENGYTTYTVEGYVVDSKHEAQLYVSIRAHSIGNHSATRIIFTYTYQGWTYKFTYNIEEHFILEVTN